jgi:transposase
MNLVDDASSTTLARVGAQETIWAAAGVLRAWIERYGVPQALYTDWKNVYVCEPTEKEQIRGIIGLPGYQITGIEEEAGKVRISARHAGPISCPHCGGTHLRLKDRRTRRPRHESWGARNTVLELESRKWQCKDCGHYFWQRFPGILPRKRAPEPFRRAVSIKHWDGISRRRLAQRERIASATVERWFQDFLRLRAAERRSALCPRVLGIDEHFFTRRHGYATTFCDLEGHKVFDVVLGRSEAALENYLSQLPGRDRVRVVSIDLANAYRALVRKYFPRARIVADRFHVIRLINQHFLACWREIDPVGAKHRGLLSLMRRHRHNLTAEQTVRLAAYLERFPVLREIYRFKQRLCYLLLKRHRTRRQCARSRGGFSKLSTSCGRPACRNWCSSARLSTAGLPRLRPCGASPAITASLRASIPRWRSCRDRPMASAISTAID